MKRILLKAESHVLTAADDGGDGGLGAVAGASYFIEQHSAVAVVAVIDGQLVSVLFRRNAARKLEHTTRGAASTSFTSCISFS